MIKLFPLPLLAALAVAACPSLVRAIDATNNITSIATATSSAGAAGTSDSYYFDNLDRAITGFSTSAGNYTAGAMANNVYVRRNTATTNNNQSSVWYDNGTTTVGGSTRPDLAGVHAANYGNLLLSNNFYGGSDNTFANGTSNMTGNIERLDFTFTTPLVASNSLAFAVFDRGAVGAHDGFAIAAITGVDGTGKPTTFSPLLKVATGWGGTTNPIADQTYQVFRYANGDNISAANPNPTTEGSTQGIGGIVIRTSDLGVATGAAVYGYALMETDVTATTSTQLANWTNATYYPTNSDDGTTAGGIDLAAVNGIAFTLVPEPSAWAALLLGGVLLAGVHHRRRAVRLRA